MRDTDQISSTSTHDGDQYLELPWHLVTVLVRSEEGLLAVCRRLGYHAETVRLSARDFNSACWVVRGASNPTKYGKISMMRFVVSRH